MCFLNSIDRLCTWNLNPNSVFWHLFILHYSNTHIHTQTLSLKFFKYLVEWIVDRMMFWNKEKLMEENGYLIGLRWCFLFLFLLFLVIPLSIFRLHNSFLLMLGFFFQMLNNLLSFLLCYFFSTSTGAFLQNFIRHCKKVKCLLFSNPPTMRNYSRLFFHSYQFHFLFLPNYVIP